MKSSLPKILFWCLFLFNFINENFSQTTKCEKREWTCNSGECIPLTSLCDGQVDCSDRSDETTESCEQNICPRYSFKCDYGACVDSATKCDGMQDCADNSDEKPETCPSVSTRLAEDFQDISTRQQEMTLAKGKPTGLNKPVSIPLPQPSAVIVLLPSDIVNSLTSLLSGDLPTIDITSGDADGEDEPPPYCKLPNLPNVITRYKESSEILEPGQLINNSVAVVYKCRGQHILDGPQINVCRNRYWTNDQPKCTKYCSGISITGITIQSTCEFAGVKIPCNEKPLRPGTKATISCRSGYEKPEGEYHETLTCNEDGQWDNLPDRCEEVCGTVQTGPLENNANYLVPWHVAIFQRTDRFRHVCSGTILNAKVVISAAHCFWYLQNNEPYDISQFNVAAGKTRYYYFANDPQKPQFLNLTDLYLPQEYKDGSQFFLNDIALLVLKDFIEFKPHIKPVCIDWQIVSNEPLKPDVIGRVAGWGVKFRSKGLRTADISVVSYEECTSQAETKYQAAFSGDKFCAGKTNETCVLEGGAGFSVPGASLNREIYYLRGIVSHGVNFEEICSNTYYVAITNIKFFSTIIEEYINRYRPLI